MFQGRRDIASSIADFKDPCTLRVYDAVPIKSAKLAGNSMPLSPGDKLGSYEILAPLGAGGMGEVYRARDSKLNRDVAVKTLPASLAADAQYMARFEREAQLLAALNHPNIAQIYGIEQGAIVMELVEGETLKGPLPIDEAIAIARQIAAGLEAAHERGIIHRDLKPANIKVTPDGTVKILDFGLAKAADETAAPASPNSPANSPTISMTMTQAGVILGTAAYMSPEQARGKTVDRRTDIWAFGVVFFEMLTGKLLFAEGETLTDVIAAVVTREPDWSALPASTPPHIRKLLERCLRKDVKTRLQAIGEARILLDHPEPEPVPAPAPATPPNRKSPLPWMAATAVLGLAALFTGISWWRATRPVDRPLVRTNLDLPGYEPGRYGNLALSADGLRLAYITRGADGKFRLATRLLAESESKILPGTEGASNPFFSPDGRWIGFGADGQLKKVLALGGAPMKLADAPRFSGASWGEDGFIVASVTVGLDLKRIPESGGASDNLAKVETLAKADAWTQAPQVLPGGKYVIFGTRDSQGPVVKLLSLATGQASTLVPGTRYARYLSTNGATGHLVYHSGSTLVAAPFDPATGELRGPAVPVLEDAGGLVSASSSGEILYWSGAIPAAWPLRWLRPDGKTETLLAQPGFYTWPRVSPDGKLLAVTVDSSRGSDTRLLVYDWRNDRKLVLAEKGQVYFGAVWTPDSRYLIWVSHPPGGKRRLYWKRADGSGEAHVLGESASYHLAMKVSPDGKYLLFQTFDPVAGYRIVAAPLDLSKADDLKMGEPLPLSPQPGNQAGATLSPDGKWSAFFSDATGQYEVYVQRFPGGGDQRKISEGGGDYPKWSSGGRQLLYQSNQGLMAVDWQADGKTLVTGKPHQWSPARILVPGSDDVYDPDPTADRAVVIPVEDATAGASPPKVAYLLHFFDELRRKAPVGK